MSIELIVVIVVAVLVIGIKVSCGTFFWWVARSDASTIDGPSHDRFG